jgi:FixJ family two-component response regulator
VTARIRIALVEDDAGVRIALSRLLHLANYEVCPFASGEEFLAAIGDSMPHCAVLDVHLPGLSGIQVQLRLRSDHVELPVVFITASEDPALDRQAFDAGGLRVLRKPFSNDDLLASIASVLPPPAGSIH